MPVIRWSTTLKPDNRPRRNFTQWKIPASLVKKHGIRDKRTLYIMVRFGNRAETKLSKTVSGQEFVVGKDLASTLKDHAESMNYAGSIDFEASFSREDLKEAIDLEYEEAPRLTDTQANLPSESVRLPETIRRALIEARRGQGAFRVRVLSAWCERCAVTGIPNGELLRASHIKPWAISDNRDRLDVHNGLPLIATLDAAFDAGLISFANDGTMLCSKRLGRTPWQTLGISQSAKLSRCPSAEQCHYLAYHRVAAHL